MSEHEPTIQVVPAVARDTSRRDWLRHAGTLIAGATAAAAVASNVRRASADQPGAMNGPVTTPPASDKGAGGAMPPDPGASQANPAASINPDVGSNPNSPAKTIPGAGKSATKTDIDILNFALGLEYLESDFYGRVVAAHQAKPYLLPRAAEVAAKLAADEAAHVTAILEILNAKGATPVAKPEFQFPQNAFISTVAFLDLAATLEVTGTGAYLGAAPKVQSKDVLKFAASVYGIEARHTGLIRLIGGMAFSPLDMEIPLTMEEVTKRVQPFIITT